MTKDLTTIDMNLLPIETLAEMANEKAELVEKNAKRTVMDAIECGKCLIGIKEQMEHGEWLPWLGANWNYSRQMASKYMSLANVNCGLHLEDAASVNDALRMIAEKKEETKPKKPAKPAADTPKASVTVVDNDPAQKPPTTRKTATGTTAKGTWEDPKPMEVRNVDHYDDVPEPEFSSQDEDPFAYATFSDCLQIAQTKLPQDDPKAAKAAAKLLRKLADKLDPPKRKPSQSDAEDIYQQYPRKAGHGLAIKAIQTALKKIDKESLESAVVAYAEAMDKWPEEDKSFIPHPATWFTQERWTDDRATWTRKANGNGTTTNLGSNGRPPVERAKIRYK